MFPFPSNGKVYSEGADNCQFRTRKRSFNSLQTGKCIQRQRISTYTSGNKVFQFPSNGKVYSENYMNGDIFQSTVQFQFPSNGKVYSETMNTFGKSHEEIVFQFPSNGKVYSEGADDDDGNNETCFNSLQTGKCIQSTTMDTNPSERFWRVSIPFKRESVFRGSR